MHSSLRPSVYREKRLQLAVSYNSALLISAFLPIVALQKIDKALEFPPYRHSNEQEDRPVTRPMLSDRPTLLTPDKSRSPKLRGGAWYPSDSDASSLPLDILRTRPGNNALLRRAAAAPPPEGRELQLPLSPIASFVEYQRRVAPLRTRLESPPGKAPSKVVRSAADEGLQLLEEAARAGLHLAMATLAAEFEPGQIAPRDADAARAWRQRAGVLSGSAVASYLCPGKETPTSVGSAVLHDDAMHAQRAASGGGMGGGIFRGTSGGKSGANIGVSGCGYGNRRRFKSSQGEPRHGHSPIWQPVEALRQGSEIFSAGRRVMYQRPSRGFVEDFSDPLSRH